MILGENIGIITILRLVQLIFRNFKDDRVNVFKLFIDSKIKMNSIIKIIKIKN